MMLEIYHNPRCSKSRQTLQLIQNKNIEVKIIEYLKDVPTSNELKEVLDKLNLSPKEILRKGEAIFKEKFKGKSFTDKEWIEHMINYPKLIERPIVVKGDTAIIGRPPENVLALL